MIRKSLTLIAVLAAVSTTAMAQEAIPSNDWTNSALASQAQAQASVLKSTVSAQQVRQEAAAARPTAFSDVTPERGSAHSTFKSTVTRAEVLAELQIYRESGLAQLEAGESVDFSSDAYIAAQARYAQLRTSSYFAQLVQRFA